MAASQRECGSLSSQLDQRKVEIANLENVNDRLSARVESLRANIVNLESENGHLANRLTAFDL